MQIIIDRRNDHKQIVIGLAGAAPPEESVTNRVKVSDEKPRRLIDPWYDVVSVLYICAVPSS
jgi:hypothetical protein